MSGDDLEVRVSALEATVERLTGRAPDAGPAAMAGAQDDRLWALNGLESRAPDGAVLYMGSVETPAGGVVRWQYARPGPELFADDWSEQADVLAALGNPVRLRMLHAVLHGVNSAAGLVEEVDAGTSGQVYHHLKELTAHGWLSSPRRGVFDVPASRIVPLLAILLAAGTP